MVYSRDAALSRGDQSRRGGRCVGGLTRPLNGLSDLNRCTNLFVGEN